MSADARLARDRRAQALLRAGERRKRRDGELRAQLVAQRARHAECEAVYNEACACVAQAAAHLNEQQARLDAWMTGAEPFSLDEFNASRTYLGVAVERCRAREADAENARRVLGEAAGAIAATNRDIARNTGSIDACGARIAKLRAVYERQADNAADDEAEDGVLARRARERTAA